MTRDDVIGVRVTPTIKRALRHAADAEERTVSRIVERIVSRWLFEHGYLRDELMAARGRGRTRRGEGQR